MATKTRTNEETRQIIVQFSSASGRISRAAQADERAFRWTFASYANDGSGLPPSLWDDIEVTDADGTIVYYGIADDYVAQFEGIRL